MGLWQQCILDAMEMRVCGDGLRRCPGLVTASRCHIYRSDGCVGVGRCGGDDGGGDGVWSGGKVC